MSKRVDAFNGMDVLVEDMEHLQLTKEEMSIERNQDYFSPGIVFLDGVTNFGLSVDGITTSLINISIPSVAYDPDGERIVIDSNLSFDASRPFQELTYGSAPESTGNVGIPLVDYADGVTNYFWVNYLDAIDPDYISADVLGSGPKYTKQISGYRVTVDKHQPTIGISDSSIYIGKVIANGVGVAPLTPDVHMDGLSLSYMYPTTIHTRAGDLLIAYADTEATSSSSSYTKVKEIQVGRSGSLRIKFDLIQEIGIYDPMEATLSSVVACIYRNGVAVGTERETWNDEANQYPWVTYTEDIHNWRAGDLCQVYLKYRTDNGTPKCKNFRLYVTSSDVYPVLMD